MVVIPKTDFGVAGRLHNPSPPSSLVVPGRDDGSERFTSRQTARKEEYTGMIHGLCTSRVGKIWGYLLVNRVKLRN
jgi:hypothetical protein